MRYILVIFSVFIFSLTVISCAKKDGSSTSSSASSSSDGLTGTYQLANNDYANGVATDSSGNVYVTGGTKGGLDGNTSSGDTDLFVIKYNSSGTKQWTKQLGSTVRDSANGIAIDSSGNVYVTGVTFGGLDWNTSAGTNDLFVVKYNSSGTKQWTKQLGSASSDFANGVATDSSGNVYVAGATYGGLDGNTNAGNSDLFVVKYNSSGTKQWTKQLGTAEYDEARGVATDLSGNVYVVGGTKGKLAGASNSGRTDVFLIKYNSSGTKQWTKSLGSNENDLANGVTTDSSGNFYVTGFTYKYLEGNTSAGSSDLFVVKYNSSGKKQWTQQLGSSSRDHARGVATDSSGNVYVTGDTYGGLDGNTSAGYNDFFVVKYDSSGTKQWTKQMGTSSTDLANGVATDPSGNVYVTGGTYGGLDGNTNAGNSDLFVVKYNSSGTKQWTKQLGTWDTDFANGVATDSSGNVYVTGSTYRSLDGNTSAGNADLFVVKYNSSGTKQWTKQLGTSSTDTANGVTTDSSGNVYVAGGTYGGLDGNTSAGVNDLFIVKYNSSGTKQWTNQLGSSRILHSQTPSK